MGFADYDHAGGGCKRHPTHRQLPGVCPSCLRERLSKIDNSANSSYKTAHSTILSISSSCISSSSSTPTTTTTATAFYDTSSAKTNQQQQQQPAGQTRRTSRHRHRRTGSDVGVALGFVLHQGGSARSSTTAAGTKVGSGRVGPAADVGLKKSRSVACAPRMIYKVGSRHGGSNRNGVGGSGAGSRNGRYGGGDGGDVDDDVDGRKIKGGGGFWKKLIHSTSKKTKGVLSHSKSSIKERSVVNVAGVSGY